MEGSEQSTANQDFYRSLRKKVDDYLNSDAGKDFRFAEFLLIAPDLFYLLVRLTMDKDVPPSDKAWLAAAVAYCVSPIDLIPDFLLPFGIIDDVAVAAFVLNRLINNTGPEIVNKYWTGKADVLESIKSIVQKADDMIGSGLWKKIKKMFSK